MLVLVCCGKDKDDWVSKMISGVEESDKSKKAEKEQDLKVRKSSLCPHVL